VVNTIEVLVIIALCTLIGWQEYQNRKEKQRLINIIISKNTQELRDLEIADQTKIKVDTKAKPEEFIPEADLTDKEFDKLIKDNG
jgi:predicted negative regulator of RcsB-dependent stress response